MSFTLLSDSENSETQVWLQFARACHYISDVEEKVLKIKSLEVGKLLHYMITNPKKFGVQ